MQVKVVNGIKAIHQLTLKQADYARLSRWLQCIQKGFYFYLFISKGFLKWKKKGDEVRVITDVGGRPTVAGYEGGGMGHKPRNVSSLYKPKKRRKQVLS